MKTLSIIKVDQVTNYKTEQFKNKLFNNFKVLKHVTHSEYGTLSMEFITSVKELYKKDTLLPTLISVTLINKNTFQEMHFDNINKLESYLTSL